MPTSLNWDLLDDVKYLDEDEALQRLLALPSLSAKQRASVHDEAVALIEATRASGKGRGIAETFLQQYSLGTTEGLALMCLAEALLRIPDVATRDRLIAEKIGSADWSRHLGRSDSLFVNASTWGLVLTGKLVDVDDEAKRDVAGWLKRLTRRVGEPVIRQAVAAAVRMMGDQFVQGTEIESALARAAREGYLCSFDMLGEGARTEADAARAMRRYADAIETVGKAAAGGAGPERTHGVSVKLSALSPQYRAVHEERVWRDLYPRVKELAVIAARHDLNFAIDAEEADRLVLSLKLFDRLAGEPELAGWSGLGIVVQAYQKRAPQVIAHIRQLAERIGCRIMVRLVKGAYWDTEIKQAQIAGCPDYPVYTTKAATDFSYLVCARALIDAAPVLYPQFATHNAHTLAAVRCMAAEAGVEIEHQRLHGMGEALYDSAKARYGALRLRAYAPVGGHEELLPYLVRRLLENGANSSFVHVLLDEHVPAEDVVNDPIGVIEANPARNPKLPLPMDLYDAERRNPAGRDYSQRATRQAAARARAQLLEERIAAGPIVGGRLLTGNRAAMPINSPGDRSIALGEVRNATAADVDLAVQLARAAQPGWDRIGGPRRATILRAMGDAIEANSDRLVALLSLEAGKTLNDGVAEVREAADFCRYYACLAERQFAGPTTLKGPVGEVNSLELRGRGVFTCISPWNFPLAIFTGQLAAALAAGNAVLAKPAEQTPLIAAEAVRLFHAAGLDADLLALIPGDGATVGPMLTGHPGIDGVAFTGGTETAWSINRALAGRDGPIVPFVAETGGLNGMFVDSTALREQVVDDVLQSAMGSAGQRCSALRLLYLPKDTADDILTALTDALDTLVLGEPGDPATDIGPVIDEEARAGLEAHVQRLRQEGRILRARDVGDLAKKGSYFGPVIAEVPSPDFLVREIFGPILHVYRYDPADLEEVATRLAARGYGLTLGVHSRIERFADDVRALVPAGNVYVNRSMVGAVVGVQPFGGEGLSGTGPKAGGPHALLRFAVERAISINIAAQGGDPALFDL